MIKVFDIHVKKKSFRNYILIFRPRSSKVCVQKLVLCEFHCKPWPSGVSLESPGLENIPQVPGKGAEVDQNHDARNAVSATVSVLK